ncbi:MAG TPA: BON domain-containing protein [Methylophilus sp.]|uniref:BON domain-containing protein n=1 Tax=Methylophilus sp. TaxID=29541 RepID=UPI002C0AD408|nr:BON domain-containing protein [Methylophilus sp.]HSH86184.1 BON domain-containing protein [Methylophilus sp.]
MKKTNYYLSSGVLVAALLGASANAMAVDVVNTPMYNFLPSDTVVQNVKNNLQTHGIDTSTLQVDSDAKGVVQLSGLVGSKQDAEVATQIAKESDGVYAVLGQWRYELAAVPVDSDAAMMEKSAPASDSVESQQ